MTMTMKTVHEAQRNSWNLSGHHPEVSLPLSGPDVQARICKAVFSVWDQAGEESVSGPGIQMHLAPWSSQGGSFLPSLGVWSLSDCRGRTGLWRNSRCTLH